MFGSWRPFFISALGAAVLLLPGQTLAMDQPETQEMETLLRDLGFDPGPVDGVVDDDTISAIRRYKEFALLPGPPEPSDKLLNELRGVAAAFAALSAGMEKAPAEAAPEVPDLSAGEPATPPEEAPSPETAVAQKVIVPPPPPPPKLKPLEVAAEKEHLVADLPPAEAGEPVADEALPADIILDPALLEDPDVYGKEAKPVDPISEGQAKIDAELAPYRKALKDGSMTKPDLAKQFNKEGRELLQVADYDAAILKFTVAISLTPDFAGAYSNRGRAYELQGERELALQDFDKTRSLGFGGVRLRSQELPLK